MKERDAAKKLFSKKGELLRKDIAAKRSKTFEVKDVTKPSSEEDKEFIQEKYRDQEAIKTAIANASTLEEVRKLELLLQQGHIPGKTVEKEGENGENKDASNEEETEEEETMETTQNPESNGNTNGTNGDMDEETETEGNENKLDENDSGNEME